MKREIKFRAWVSDLGKMVYSADDMDYSWVIINDGVISLVDLWDDSYVTAELMQFTGLTDKNGKEIYEGDIILDNGVKREILWFDEGCQFISVNLTKDRDWDIITDPTVYGRNYLEVIGNIHENPELLR